MILHREGRPRGVTQAFNRPVVEIEVRDLDVVWQRGRVDGKPMVLRRDLNSSGAKLLHWMVSAAMSKLQLKRVGPERQTHDLVSETDAKRGNVLRHDRARILN